LDDEFKLGFDDVRINEIAYEGEKAYAGTPSGIDNTASTYGGLLRFEKNLTGEENRIELLKVKKPIRIVMGNTGITADTKAAVTGVKERKGKELEKYDRIFREARTLVGKADVALQKYDLEALGRLMDRNHRLLQEIEVSHPKLDELVELARRNGAYGAKLTGGGLGGYMVALTPEKQLQEKVARAMEASAYEAFRTTIGI
jgi:mevalonate kinase